MVVPVLRIGAVLLVLMVAGCITVVPDYDQKQATAVPNEPNAWQQILPHGGDLVALTVPSGTAAHQCKVCVCVRV